MCENRMCTCMCNWVTMVYSIKKNCIGEITKKKLKKLNSELLKGIFVKFTIFKCVDMVRLQLMINVIKEIYSIGVQK